MLSELMVLECLGEGLNNKEIAARLDLSLEEVKNILIKLYHKYEVKNRIQLLVKYYL